MDFTQKIYYNNKPLIVAADVEALRLAHPLLGGYVVAADNASPDYAAAFAMLDDSRTQGVLVQDGSIDVLLAHLSSVYKTIVAGGGLVYNEHGDILMIYRRGKWDLPKGKLDEGETIDECALREVSEETGVNQLTLGSLLCNTYHIYQEKGRYLLKHTVWFSMKAAGVQNLVPQPEEDILEARWVNPRELQPFVGNTYEAIKDVLIHAGMAW